MGLYRQGSDNKDSAVGRVFSLITNRFQNRLTGVLRMTVKLHNFKNRLKKIIQILLLVLFLFNCFGYRFLISYIENKADLQLEEQLDNNNYDESQLISVKVPIAYLPYYNNSKTFERVNGQIEIHGTPFKYVKRRIYNDSLELLCIPNATAMKLQTTRNEFFKFVNDLQQGKKSESHPHSVKVPSINDYISNDPLQFGDLYCSNSLSSHPYTANIPFCYSLTEEHPPQNC
jgi:hypothetical protein